MTRNPEHVRYLQPWGNRDAVKLDCTCGGSHGIRTWRTFASALADGEFDYYIPFWKNNPLVSRICANYAASRPAARAQA